MPTKTISGDPNNKHANLKAGATINISSVSDNTGALSSTNYGVTSISLTCDRMQMHSKYGYFDIYNQSGTKIGNTQTFGNNSKWDGDSGTKTYITLSVSLSSESAALGATSFYLINRHSNGSTTSSTCNFRQASGTNTAYVHLNIVYYSKNSAPGAPTIIYPASANAITYNQKPWFRFKTGTDAESSSITTYWRVDSGSWQSYSSTINSNNDKQWTASTLAIGSHTVEAYCSDGSLTSGTVSRSFKINSPAAAITKGSLVDDAQMTTMRTQINNLRAYYNLGAGSYSTLIAGTTVYLDDHIDELEKAFEETPHKTDVATVNAGEDIVIANLNNIRTGLLNG